MNPVFVDTTVLLHSEDGAQPDKQQRAIDWLRRLWLERSGRLSTQVLDDFYVTATRVLRPAMPPGDARAEVRRYQRWQPWTIDHATVETAWAVESRFGLHYRDALILAAAQALRCRLVLSEQLPHDQQIDSVRILNPFLVGPEVLDTLP